MEVVSALIVVIAFVSNIILGLLTYYQNPKSKTNLFFFLFSISISIYLLSNNLAITQVTDTQTLFWIRFVIGIAFVINQFFLFLALTFPNPTLNTRPWIVYGSILFTMIMIPLSMTGFIFASVTPGTTQPNPGPGIGLFMVHNILYLGGGFLVLIRNFRKAQGILKSQYRFFWQVFLLCLPQSLLPILFLWLF